MDEYRAINHVRDGLYVTSLDGLFDLDTLNIDVVVSLTEKAERHAKKISERVWRKCYIEDDDQTDLEVLLEWLEPVVASINEDLDNNKAVLVHCYAGQSRAGMVVIATLINRYGMTLQEAYKTVCKARQVIEPSVWFIWVLDLWAQKHGHDASIPVARMTAKTNKYEWCSELLRFQLTQR